MCRCGAKKIHWRRSTTKSHNRLCVCVLVGPRGEGLDVRGRVRACTTDPVVSHTLATPSELHHKTHAHTHSQLKYPPYYYFYVLLHITPPPPTDPPTCLHTGKIPIMPKGGVMRTTHAQVNPRGGRGVFGTHTRVYNCKCRFLSGGPMAFDLRQRRGPKVFLRHSSRRFF